MDDLEQQPSRTPPPGDGVSTGVPNSPAPAAAALDPEKIRVRDILTSLTTKQLYGTLTGLLAGVAAVFAAGYGSATYAGQSELKMKEAELVAKETTLASRDARNSAQEADLFRREAELRTRVDATRAEVEEARRVKAGFDMARFVFLRGRAEKAFKEWKDASASLTGPIPAGGEERSDRLDRERNVKQLRMNLDEDTAVLARLIHRMAGSGLVRVEADSTRANVVEVVFTQTFEEVAPTERGKRPYEPRLDWRVPDGVTIPVQPS